MIIGKMDRKIAFQVVSEPNDDFGGSTPSWTTVISCWASLTPGGGIEKDEADKVTATSPVVFGIRYKAGIDEKMRILYNSEIYNIISIAEPDRRKSLQITANKKV
jgi:SPP1 family predicted phage head-tail adaptor